MSMGDGGPLVGCKLFREAIHVDGRGGTVKQGLGKLLKDSFNTVL